MQDQRDIVGVGQAASLRRTGTLPFKGEIAGGTVFVGDQGQDQDQDQDELLLQRAALPLYLALTLALNVNLTLAKYLLSSIPAIAIQLHPQLLYPSTTVLHG